MALLQEEANNEQVHEYPLWQLLTRAFDDEYKEMQMKTRDNLLSINVFGIWDLFIQL